MAQVAARLSTGLASRAKRFGDAAQPKLQVFWKYAQVELKPPMPNEIPAVSKGFANLLKSAATGKFTQLTVKEAWLNTLVAAEIGCWFFVGEVIGKRAIVGYPIEGAVNYEAHV